MGTHTQKLPPPRHFTEKSPTVFWTVGDFSISFYKKVIYGNHCFSIGFFEAGEVCGASHRKRGTKGRAGRIGWDK